MLHLIFPGPGVSSLREQAHLSEFGKNIWRWSCQCAHLRSGVLNKKEEGPFSTHTLQECALLGIKLQLFNKMTYLPGKFSKKRLFNFTKVFRREVD